VITARNGYPVLNHSYKQNGVTRILFDFDMVFRSLTIMLIAASSYSIVTTFPRLVAVGMNRINHSVFVTLDDYYFYIWAVHIIAPWNYCGNFFFYFLSGRQFRKELALMFRCRKRQSGAFLLIYLFISKPTMTKRSTKHR